MSPLPQVSPLFLLISPSRKIQRPRPFVALAPQRADPSSTVDFGPCDSCVHMITLCQCVDKILQQQFEAWIVDSR